MKNSRNNTLEDLEKDKWSLPPTGSSFLVKRTFVLRKKQLKDFTIEDLRIMIGQKFSLNKLMPLAIEKLEQNILSEGDLYEGDLLTNVLNADVNFWKSNYELWLSIKNLFEANKELLDEKEHRQILKDFKKFEEIHHDRY